MYIIFDYIEAFKYSALLGSKRDYSNNPVHYEIHNADEDVVMYEISDQYTGKNSR